MQIAPIITYRGTERMPEIDAVIERRVQKLERVGGRLTSCRVEIERVQRSQREAQFRVRVDVTVPGKELVASEESAKGIAARNLPRLVTRTFGVVRRQLRDLNRMRHRRRKSHAGPDLNTEVVDK